MPRCEGSGRTVSDLNGDGDGSCPVCGDDVRTEFDTWVLTEHQRGAPTAAIHRAYQLLADRHTNEYNRLLRNVMRGII